MLEPDERGSQAPARERGHDRPERGSVERRDVVKPGLVEQFEMLLGHPVHGVNGIGGRVKNVVGEGLRAFEQRHARKIREDPDAAA